LQTGLDFRQRRRLTALFAEEEIKIAFEAIEKFHQLRISIHIERAAQKLLANPVVMGISSSSWVLPNQYGAAPQAVKPGP